MKRGGRGHICFMDLMLNYISVFEGQLFRVNADTHKCFEQSQGHRGWAWVGGERVTTIVGVMWLKGSQPAISYIL